MRILIILFFMFNLVSCNDIGSQGPSIPGVHEDYHLRMLFEVEGCKMFRFYDQTLHRYWIKCNNGEASILK